MFADLGAPVLNKCADMESRGGVSTVRNQDVRKDVSKLVEKEGGGAAAAEPGSASISAGDAQPMEVDIRVSKFKTLEHPLAISDMSKLLPWF